MSKDDDCCFKCLDREFQPHNLGLNHNDPSAFFRSQWPKINRFAYIVYRVVVAIGFFVWLVINITEEIRWFYAKHPHLWFTFATNWSFFLLCVSYVTRAVLTLYFNIGRKDFVKYVGMPLVLKCSWFVNIIAWNATIVVSVCFWVFIISMDTTWYYRTPGSEVKHSLASILVLIDLFISCDPVRVLHLIYPILVGLFYVMFNGVYYALNGRGPMGKHALYTVLDWKRPGMATLTIFMTIVCSIVTQILLHELYRLRSYIFRKTYPEYSGVSSGIEAPSDEQTRILTESDVKYDATESNKTE